MTKYPLVCVCVCVHVIVRTRFFFCFASFVSASLHLPSLALTYSWPQLETALRESELWQNKREFYRKLKTLRYFSIWQIIILQHCQRHNGPEGWVLLTKLTSLGHVTSSNTNLDQTSESQPCINFKISTKHHHFDKT